MKLLFCLLLDHASAKRFDQKLCHSVLTKFRNFPKTGKLPNDKMQFELFNSCTEDSKLRYSCCNAVINHFKQECDELNAHSLPDGFKDKEWVSKK